jgi:hypothetical protein
MNTERKENGVVKPEAWSIRKLKRKGRRESTH